MNLDSGTRLLFIGDSVTDCGRARPVGTGAKGTLGGGYVAMVDASLSAVGTTPPIEVLNTGTSADTVRHLALRWEADVLAHKPDWLSVMIGINDVWRQFDGNSAAAVMPEEYERVYEELLARTQPGLKGLVLMSPYYVQDKRTDPLRARMDEYGAIVKRIAKRRGAVFVDVQTAFDAMLARRHYSELAADRVHPTPEGHRILAVAFLKAVGLTPRPRP
ncbi:MAG TPA: SGNH/GDSL hydrolase family protein [Opitutaceae bacterium]